MFIIFSVYIVAVDETAVVIGEVIVWSGYFYNFDNSEHFTKSGFLKPRINPVIDSLWLITSKSSESSDLSESSCLAYKLLSMSLNLPCSHKSELNLSSFPMILYIFYIWVFISSFFSSKRAELSLRVLHKDW